MSAAFDQHCMFYERGTLEHFMGQYIISVVAIAVIISISQTLVQEKTVFGSIFKLITGLILTISIVSPWLKVRMTDFQDLMDHAQIDASVFVQEGQYAYQSEMNKLIIDQTQAYIMDKAVSLGMSICVEVVLADQTIPSIDSIKIVGNASPYAKQRMIQIIQEDVGISQEQVVWI